MLKLTRRQFETFESWLNELCLEKNKCIRSSPLQIPINNANKQDCVAVEEGLTNIKRSLLPVYFDISDVLVGRFPF